MSFLKTNTYFVQNFESEIRKLSQDLKLEYYGGVRVKCRERMMKSYPSSGQGKSETELSELYIYYRELFDVFGEFEFEFLLMNLFFEPRFTKIVLWLQRNTQVFEKFYDLSFEAYTFRWLYYQFFKEKDYSFDIFYSFLKKVLTTHTDLNVNDFRLSNSEDLNLTHKYPKWILNNLEDVPKAVFIHLLLLKFLSRDNHLTHHDYSSKLAIVFLFTLNRSFDEKIENNHFPKIDEFLHEIRDVLDNQLFNKELSRTPFLNESNPHYNKGYYVQRNLFLDKVNQCIVMNKNLEQESYESLLKMNIGSNQSLKTKLKDTISNKLSRFVYPTKSEVNMLLIKDIGDDDMKSYLKKKLYLF